LNYLSGNASKIKGLFFVFDNTTYCGIIAMIILDKGLCRRKDLIEKAPLLKLCRYLFINSSLKRGENHE